MSEKKYPKYMTEKEYKTVHIALLIFLIIILFLTLFSGYIPLGKGSSPLHSFRCPDLDNNLGIPPVYTCDGENISPEFSWKYQATPPGEKKRNIQSYVLIMEDMDAQKFTGKPFVHWIVLLPTNVIHLPKGISGSQGSQISSLGDGAREIINDSGHTAYYGPCPPVGDGVHTYNFMLFAMSIPASDMNSSFFKAPFTVEKFWDTMRESIIVGTGFIAKYIRQ